MHNADGSPRPDSAGLLDQDAMLDADLKTYGWIYGIAYGLELEQYQKEQELARGRS